MEFAFFGALTSVGALFIFRKDKQYEKILIALLLIFALALPLVSCDSSKYKNAIELISSGNYEEAYVLFKELGDYKDSEEYLSRFWYMPVKLSVTYEDDDGFLEEFR